MLIRCSPRKKCIKNVFSDVTQLQSAEVTNVATLKPDERKGYKRSLSPK